MRFSRPFLPSLILTTTLAIAFGSSSITIAQQPPAEQDQYLRIYYLRHTEAQVLAELISEMLANRVDQRGRDDEKPAVQTAVDRRLNALLVRGPAAGHEMAEALIRALDVPKDRNDEAGDAVVQPSHERLLFYWLATGPDFTTDGPIPEQLQPVVTELQRLGLDNVQLVSRALAAFNGDRVSIETTVDVAERTYSLEFEGAFAGDGDSAPGDLSTRERLRWRSGLAPRSLTIRVTAAEQTGAPAGFKRGRERPKSCSLATQITTPRNHFVVLGVTGLGDLENAFVIQIQANDPAKGSDDSDTSGSEE